jgi:hypothetical protein
MFRFAGDRESNGWNFRNRQGARVLHGSASHVRIIADLSGG